MSHEGNPSRIFKTPIGSLHFHNSADIFNPLARSTKFDPRGVYIRKKLPVLEKIFSRVVHESWTIPEDEEKGSGCRIERDYSLKIIDHAKSLRRALVTYRTVREKYSRNCFHEDFIKFLISDSIRSDRK